MKQQRASPVAQLDVRDDQPLIGIVLPENGQLVTHYFTEEVTADAAVSKRRIEAAMSVIGAWSDLDWDVAIAELDSISRASKPTPPIDDL